MADRSWHDVVLRNESGMNGADTIIDKIWATHRVLDYDDGRSLLYVDRHLIHEGTSGPAFERLRRDAMAVRRPDLTFAVVDHGVSTAPGRTIDSYPPTRQRHQTMRDNCRDSGIDLLDIGDPGQGIVHVIAPEQGLILPGSTLACGDSHSATCGGLGALGWGIGTSEVHQVLATQTILQKLPRRMRAWFDGRLQPGVFAKDMILALIGRYGVGAGLQHAVEYAGPAIRALSIEGRMTICNMSVEFGARAGVIGIDDATLDYLSGRRFAPQGEHWDQAVPIWRAHNTDENAVFDTEIALDVSTLAPQVTWGTSPEHVAGVDGHVPDPDTELNDDYRKSISDALGYMALRPNQPIEGTPIDYAFIGSCTNGRLSDLEAAARIVAGRKVAPGVEAWVVPGSTAVKRAAEANGLDRIFRDAGFRWRESGCSMCVATNGEVVPAGKRSISTSNRNFENRQGQGSMTHLASPAMVAAAAVNGQITDVRKLWKDS
jgi:3-isopropylmalate/(R)-2-methylmalate dehydratase large subunit